jgi:DNA replication ATP-dependent helicase Dna2
LELYKEQLNDSDIFFEKYELYEEFYVYLNKSNLKFVLYDKNFNKNIILLQILKNKLDEEAEKILSSLQLNSKILLKKVGKYSKSSFKLERGNLFTFISNPLNSKIISNLQKIILYNKEPKILNETEQNNIYTFISNYFPEINNLNNDQLNALKKCLFSKDYALIQGFPGSGKTFFISLLVKILYKLNKKIFITAHTNIAVDNILEKLIEFNIPFLRISNPYNKDIINEKIKKYTINCQNFSNVDEVNIFLNKKIYAGTELSIYNEIIKFKEFDYVIIDEAAQSRELEILGPLMIGEKFILVGDQNQLGAIYKSISYKDAPKSLFQRLYERNNYKVNSVLKLQYRMNKEILNFTNCHLYNNLMKCADKEIEEKKLNINLSKINKLWLRQILDPEKSIIFCDYYNEKIKDELNKIEDYNLYEANLIIEIIKNLNNIFDYNEIGVITLYKAQEELLKKYLKNCFFNNIFTIDKSQGIEKEIIIISFCKTNDRSILLYDINRLNVAFTRAKTKLILIGVKNILIKYDKLKDYINKLDEKKLIYNFDFNLLDLNNINKIDNIINELKLINND